MTSRIFLGQKQIATVDDEDADLIPRHQWKITKVSNSSDNAINYFAVTCRGTRGTWILHRIIMERIMQRPLDRSELVIHKDGNFLNFTRSNLEIISFLQQARRKNKQHKKAGSKYKGVHLSLEGTWIARIKTPDARKHIGCYQTEVEAAIAYNAAVIGIVVCNKVFGRDTDAFGLLIGGILGASLYADIIGI